MFLIVSTQCRPLKVISWKKINTLTINAVLHILLYCLCIFLFHFQRFSNLIFSVKISSNSEIFALNLLADRGLLENFGFRFLLSNVSSVSQSCGQVYNFSNGIRLILAYAFIFSLHVLTNYGCINLTYFAFSDALKQYNLSWVFFFFFTQFC